MRYYCRYCYAGYPTKKALTTHETVWCKSNFEVIKREKGVLVTFRVPPSLLSKIDQSISRKEVCNRSHAFREALREKYLTN